MTMELENTYMSVQEQVYFDTVGHALETWHEYPKGYRQQMLEEANAAGRSFATNDDVRVIFKCMDLGLSPRECVKYLTDDTTRRRYPKINELLKEALESYLHWV